jgi:hypothetical protein
MSKITAKLEMSRRVSAGEQKPPMSEERLCELRGFAEKAKIPDFLLKRPAWDWMHLFQDYLREAVGELTQLRVELAAWQEIAETHCEEVERLMRGPLIRRGVAEVVVKLGKPCGYRPGLPVRHQCGYCDSCVGGDQMSNWLFCPHCGSLLNKPSAPTPAESSGAEFGEGGE